MYSCRYYTVSKLTVKDNATVSVSGMGEGDIAFGTKYFGTSKKEPVESSDVIVTDDGSLSFGTVSKGDSAQNVGQAFETAISNGDLAKLIKVADSAKENVSTKVATVTTDTNVVR